MDRLENNNDRFFVTTNDGATKSVNGTKWISKAVIELIEDRSGQGLPALSARELTREAYFAVLTEFWHGLLHFFVHTYPTADMAISITKERDNSDDAKSGSSLYKIPKLQPSPVKGAVATRLGSDEVTLMSKMLEGIKGLGRALMPGSVEPPTFPQIDRLLRIGSTPVTAGTHRHLLEELSKISNNEAPFQAAEIREAGIALESRIPIEADSWFILQSVVAEIEEDRNKSKLHRWAVEGLECETGVRLSLLHRVDGVRLSLFIQALKEFPRKESLFKAIERSQLFREFKQLRPQEIVAAREAAQGKPSFLEVFVDQFLTDCPTSSLDN